MDPEAVADRGAELAERITSEIGPGWTERIGGEKSILVADDDTVSLSAGDWYLYLGDDGELCAQIRRDERIWTGHWIEGEFEVLGSVPAPDPTRN
jgi:hypothetical protein